MKQIKEKIKNPPIYILIDRKSREIEGYFDIEGIIEYLDHKVTEKEILRAYRNPYLSIYFGQYDVIREDDEIDTEQKRFDFDHAASIGIGKYFEYFIDSTGRAARKNLRTGIVCAMKTHYSNGLPYIYIGQKKIYINKYMHVTTC